MKNSMSRRDFLGNSARGAAALSTLGLAVAGSRPVSAADKVVCTVIGARGMGLTHARMLARDPGAVVAAICDVDREMGERAVKTVKDITGTAPKLYGDFRKALEDQSIDAVTIATPNHWHTPIAILAMQAGKDVYNEKMGSHVFREGQLLIKAAKKYGRVVQHGTQMRSSEVTTKAREVLDSGVIGEVKMSKAWNLQKLDAIPVLPDAPVPSGVDYDMWLGPAPKSPFNPNRFHFNWIFFRTYGNGDLGGDGIHDIDMAHFGLNPKTHPVKVTAHGSNVEPAQAREFPDNMVIAYQYENGHVLLYEDRLWTPYGRYGFDSGNAFYGTEGFMVFSRRGYFQVYLGQKEEKGPGMKGTGGHPQHMVNFLDCVRTRKQPIANIEKAHQSLALIHLGEIAFRTGISIDFDPKKEVITNSEKANKMLAKEYYRDPWNPEKMLA